MTIFVDRTVPALELIIAIAVNRWLAWRVADRRRRNHVARHTKAAGRVEAVTERAPNRYRGKHRRPRLPNVHVFQI